jgi:predicted Zn-dependent protease
VPNWLSTHPAPADRVEKISPFIQQTRASMTTPPIETDPASFLRRLDGIVYGDSPSEGIVRGNAFLHPDLRLAVTFPKGWEIQNTQTQVMAKAPGREDYMLLQLVQNPRGSVDQIAQAGMANAGFRQLNGQPTKIDGADAYVGTYQGNLQGLGNVVVLAAHIVHERNVYVVAGLAPPADLATVRPAFESSIGSFRSLTREEAAAIKPNRVDVYTVRAGDSWQSIAERTGQGTLSADTLAIMNSQDPGQQPRPGERVKVVVAG